MINRWRYFSGSYHFLGVFRHNDLLDSLPSLRLSYCFFFSAVRPVTALSSYRSVSLGLPVSFLKKCSEEILQTAESCSQTRLKLQNLTELSSDELREVSRSLVVSCRSKTNSVRLLPSNYENSRDSMECAGPGPHNSLKPAQYRAVLNIGKILHKILV